MRDYDEVLVGDLDLWSTGAERNSSLAVLRMVLHLAQSSKHYTNCPQRLMKLLEFLGANVSDGPDLNLQAIHLPQSVGLRTPMIWWPPKRAGMLRRLSMALQLITTPVKRLYGVSGCQLAVGGFSIQLRFPGVACTAANMNPEEIASGPFAYQKIFMDGDFIASGIMTLPVDGKKPLKSTRDNTYVCDTFHSHIE